MSAFIFIIKIKFKLGFGKKLISDTNQSIEYLRSVGKQKILETIDDLKNGGNVPNDLLTNILKNGGI